MHYRIVSPVTLNEVDDKEGNLYKMKKEKNLQCVVRVVLCERSSCVLKEAH